MKSEPTTNMLPLWGLPDELTDQILNLLDYDSLKAVCLVSQRAYDLAIGLVWRNVTLTDCRNARVVSEDVLAAWRRDHDEVSGPDSYLRQLRGNSWEGADEHDDTPIIRKLAVLASNASIAGQVLSVTHQCHLPLPSIFSELSHVSFSSNKLSNDWRTLRLARLAIKNMTSVQTLRIVNGHPNLTAVLLQEFLSCGTSTLRRLWLESCSLAAVPSLNILEYCLPKLESVRFRRLKLVNGQWSYSYSRGGGFHAFQNGRASHYETSVRFSDWGDEWRDVLSLTPESLSPSFTPSTALLNEAMYDCLPEAKSLAENPCLMDDRPVIFHPENVGTAYGYGLYRIIQWASSTLTNLTLDWILTSQPHYMTEMDNQYNLFHKLSNLTFPKLRAFQLRNAVTSDTKLAVNIYLLHPTMVQYESIDFQQPVNMLGFLERHNNLQCLAWPMDRFYNHKSVSKEEASRAREVVTKLGQTLLSLRVDHDYTARGEVQTDNALDFQSVVSRSRRRLFVSEFASRMLKLKSLKMEGGIPRDEKRETVRAVHRCPLEKVVLIGVSCPLGNTWGAHGVDLSNADDGHLSFHGILEPEHEDALRDSAAEGSLEDMSHFTFRGPGFGWPPAPPLLHTMALHFSTTITEIKLCGYNGSPILHKPTAITPTLFHHLRYFHNLRHLILSLWLMTYFDWDYRELEIVEYWISQRESTSTAVVPFNEEAQEVTDRVEQPAHVLESASAVDPPSASDNVEMEMDISGVSPASFDPDLVDDTTFAWEFGHLGEIAYSPPEPIVDDESVEADDGNAWAIALQERYSPKVMAHAVYDLVGPHLSMQARSKKYADGRNGVNVRGSFCLGADTGDIFDLDVLIDDREGGVVPGAWKGPREEGEKERWRGKMDGRQWF
jgi:hypothetical protein